MKAKELTGYGIPQGKTLKKAFRALAAARKAGMSPDRIRTELKAVVHEPRAYLSDPIFGKLAAALANNAGTLQARQWQERAQPAPYRTWGENLDTNSIAQMQGACRLPVAVRGALMPDAHLGYGLPIGGVLAVRDAVIPYAVGVDIACRMKMTVLDLPVESLQTQAQRLRRAIQQQTRFGIGATVKNPRQHPVMDEDWDSIEILRRHKDRGWKQLGTSGSGNHFVEFGILSVERDELGLSAGEFLALLSHSGSRGVGNAVATHYSKLAMSRRRDLPQELRHLAWLDLSSAEGQEYWRAMQLMGRYAAANHELIHRHIATALGAQVRLDIENHHNFAWLEQHDGQQLVVHRKGATPASENTVGIIPGSMATPAFVVRGKGNAASLCSASHGAGRVMSRSQAKKRFKWRQANELLAREGVTLISAGLDEVPMVYKDIEQVMAAQRELVTPLARFAPKLVKMAPAGERPED